MLGVQTYFVVVAVLLAVLTAAGTMPPACCSPSPSPSAPARPSCRPRRTLAKVDQRLEPATKRVRVLRASTHDRRAPMRDHGRRDDTRRFGWGVLGCAVGGSW